MEEQQQIKRNMNKKKAYKNGKGWNVFYSKHAVIGKKYLLLALFLLFSCRYRQKMLSLHSNFINNLPIAYGLYISKRICREVRHLRTNCSQLLLHRKDRVSDVGGQDLEYPSPSYLAYTEGEEESGIPTSCDPARTETNEAKGGIYHRTQIDLTYNSNHIEGSRLSHEQTRYIFETNTIGISDQSVNGIISRAISWIPVSQPRISISNCSITSRYLIRNKMKWGLYVKEVCLLR